MESDERVAPPLARTSSTGQKQAMSSAVGTPGNSNAIIRSKPAPERHETQKEHVSNPSFCERFLGPVSRADLFYIATWGIFGTIARVYIDRIFGSDCENNGADDFWSASNICITANGRTERKGGALFVDLPANILGSFLMGLFSASAEHPLPWFPRDHHLQQNKSWQKGLTTGFCGCLTTFASWNTQMVVMIDGTYAENGSQVPSALVGYALGLLTAVAAYMWGRVVADMWRNTSRENNQSNRMFARTFDEDEENHSDDSHHARRDHSEGKANHDDISCPSDEQEESDSPRAVETQSQVNEGVPDNEDEKSVDEELSADDIPHLGGTILYFATLCAATGSILGFAYGDVSGEYMFYRRMWMVCLCTPFGAVLRSQLNQWLPTSRSIQWGTLSANAIGAMISIILEVLLQRFLTEEQTNSQLGTFLWAVKVGFAGSLSTVSTFVKELVSLERLIDRHMYGVLTIAVGMVVGLGLYIPLVRI